MFVVAGDPVERAATGDQDEAGRHATAEHIRWYPARPGIAEISEDPISVVLARCDDEEMAGPRIRQRRQRSGHSGVVDGEEVGQAISAVFRRSSGRARRPIVLRPLADYAGTDVKMTSPTPGASARRDRCRGLDTARHRSRGGRGSGAAAATVQDGVRAFSNTLRRLRGCGPVCSPAQSGEGFDELALLVGEVRLQRITEQVDRGAQPRHPARAATKANSA